MAKERRSFFDKLLNGKNNNLVQKTLLKGMSRKMCKLFEIS